MCGSPDAVAPVERAPGSRVDPQPGEVLVLIGHSSNISALSGVSLAEGAGVVLRPGSGGPTVLGTLTPADWAELRA